MVDVMVCILHNKIIFTVLLKALKSIRIFVSKRTI